MHTPIYVQVTRVLIRELYFDWRQISFQLDHTESRHLFQHMNATGQWLTQLKDMIVAGRHFIRYEESFSKRNCGLMQIFPNFSVHSYQFICIADFIFLSTLFQNVGR